MVNSHLVRLWKDRMEVTVKQSYKRADKSTGFQDVVTITDEPCKISFVDNMAFNLLNEPDGVASPLKKITKLFCSPDLDIPPGSKIAITHKGATEYYTHSSKPSIFTNHQEILLDALDKWV